MELATVGTLSTLTQEGRPLGIGVRFAVDPEGTPVLSLNATNKHFPFDTKSSLHVQVRPSLSFYMFGCFEELHCNEFQFLLNS